MKNIITKLIINALLVLSVMLFPQLSFSEPKGTFCSKPIGSAVSKIQKERMDVILEVFENTKYKNIKYLYFSDFNDNTLTNPGLKSRVRDEFRYSSEFIEKMHELTSNFGERDGNAIGEYMLDEYTKEPLIGADEKYVYANSNSAEFYNFAKIEGVKNHGAAITLNLEGFEAFFMNASNEQGQLVRAEFEKTNPEIIIIDGFRPPLEVIEQISNKALVLYIDDQIKHARELKSYLKLLTEPHLPKTTYINLLPKKTEDASHWGFDDERSDRYVLAGKAFNRELSGSYIDETTPKTGKREFLEVLRTNILERKLTIVIGESSDNGNSLRLPGTSEVITKEDLSSLPKSKNNLFFIACNSSEFSHDLSPISFVGTVYSKDALGFLRATLGKASKDTIGEYLYIPIDKTEFTKALGKLNKEIDGKGISIAKYLTLYSIRTGETPDSYKNNENNENNENKGQHHTLSINGVNILWIAAISFFGGLCREIFRWKRLIERNRHPRFFKPKYIAVSLLVMLCGVGVALIFANIINSPQYIYPVSFICGVGVEKIIQLAAQLKIWIPNVPLGSGDDNTPSSHNKKDPSIISYLRN